MYSRKNIPLPFQGRPKSESSVMPSHTISLEGSEKSRPMKRKQQAAPLAAFLLLHTLLTEKKDG